MEELTQPQRDALEAIYYPFQATGKWQTFLYLERKLGSAGDVLWDTLRSLPDERLLMPGDIVSSPWPSRFYPDTQELSLTITGLACLGTAKPDLDLFIRALPLVIGVLDGMAPEDPAPARVTAEALMAELRIGDPAIRRLWWLLTNDPFIHGGSSSGSETWATWALTIRQTASRYRGVENLVDYLRVRKRWTDRETGAYGRAPAPQREGDAPAPISLSAPERLWGTVRPALRHPAVAPVIAGIVLFAILGLLGLGR